MLFITSRGKHYVQSLIAHKLFIVYKWLTHWQSNSYHSISRAYAYTRLAQGLNESMISFVRSYLDSCLAAKLCTLFMDDIGCGVETFEQMIPTLPQLFDCLRKSGLRLTPHKCEIGMTNQFSWQYNNTSRAKT